MKKILVVCMGNICRSPTGEAVLRAKAQQLGVEVEVDSAGTIGYHQGNHLMSEREKLLSCVDTLLKAFVRAKLNRVILPSLILFWRQIMTTCMIYKQFAQRNTKQS